MSCGYDESPYYSSNHQGGLYNEGHFEDELMKTARENASPYHSSNPQRDHRGNRKGDPRKYPDTPYNNNNGTNVHEVLGEVLSARPAVIKVSSEDTYAWTSSDFAAFELPDPNESLPDFTERAKNKILENIELKRFMLQGKPLVVQWRGDDLRKSYAALLHGILGACRHLKVNVICVLCTKMLSQSDWETTRAAELCNLYEVPGISVAPTESIDRLWTEHGLSTFVVDFTSGGREQSEEQRPGLNRVAKHVQLITGFK